MGLLDACVLYNYNDLIIYEDPATYGFFFTVIYFLLWIYDRLPEPLMEEKEEMPLGLYQVPNMLNLREARPGRGAGAEGREYLPGRISYKKADWIVWMSWIVIITLVLIPLTI